MSMEKTILERVISTRTIRKYDPSAPVTVDDLRGIIECVRYAPSAANLQRIKYTFLTGEEAEDCFFNVSLGGYLPENERPTYEERPSAYIVMLSELMSPDPLLAMDMGIAAELISLSAAERGLGTCIIKNFKTDNIVPRLQNSYSPLLLIAVGKPKETALAVDIGDDESIKYYHDENGRNIVPKRKLSDIIVE